VRGGGGYNVQKVDSVRGGGRACPAENIPSFTSLDCLKK